jgi:hypothetical protein
LGQAEAHYDVSFGDVRDAQIVIGDHTTVVTPDGVKVVRLVGSSRPTPRRAAGGERPAPTRPLVGREGELELASRAASGWPLQLVGAEGMGKTSLLKHVGADAPPGPVVYATARRRSLDDIQATLFRAFWETEERFVPAPDEMPAYLAGVDALVVFDDLQLDRDDLGVLLDSAPACAFVLASTERTLWGRGAAHELLGLGPDESVELIERELGRSLEGEERVAALELARDCAGRPQSLVEVAASVLDRLASLEELARRRSEGGEGLPVDARLSAVERRLLGVLGAVSGAALGTDHLGALATAGDAEALLAGLERRGWVKSQSPRYRLARALPANAEAVPLAAATRELSEWARRAATVPEDVAEESEAIEALVERSLREGRHDLALELVRATESKLATAGLLGSWERVLEGGVEAARAGGSGYAHDEGYMMHELGSRAIGVRSPVAREQLMAALAIRERIGDEKGAALTRHNLAQLGGGPSGNGHAKRNGGPRRPRLGPTLGGLGLLAALGVGAALVVAQGDGDSASRPPGADAAVTTRGRAADPTTAPAGGTTSGVTPSGRGGATPGGTPSGTTGAIPGDEQPDKEPDKQPDEQPDGQPEITGDNP